MTLYDATDKCIFFNTFLKKHFFILKRATFLVTISFVITLLISSASFCLFFASFPSDNNDKEEKFFLNFYSRFFLFNYPQEIFVSLITQIALK